MQRNYRNYASLLGALAVVALLMGTTGTHTALKNVSSAAMAPNIDFDTELELVMARNRADLEARQYAANAQGYEDALKGGLEPIKKAIRAAALNKERSYRDEHVEDLSTGTLETEKTHYWRGFIRAARSQMGKVRIRLGSTNSCRAEGCVILYDW